MTSTTKSVPRAEQVGSLKRSNRLVAANEALYAPGHVAIEHSERARGLDELYAIAQEDTLRVLKKQVEIGLDVVTDGEFRRYMFLNSLFDGITGFSSEVSKARFKAADGSVVEWNMQYVVDRVKQVDSPAAREAAFLADATDRLYKVTFPAGSFLALPYNFKAEINGHAYESHRRLVEDVVAIEKRMIADVVAAGCRYVQLDFPVYPFLCDPDWKARMEKHGYAWKETLELAQWADREVIAGLPDHVRTGLHVCRGNNQSRHVAEGALDPVAETLFALPYDSFLIEWEDKARTGDYTALRHVPPGDSVVVLGIVSSKHPTLEKQDDLLRELDRASAYLEPGRLAISPQCGFASTLKGNLVTEDDQWRKLELVASTARRYWS
ncbi:MAG TPA: cobalamin-independent methionine synthase II family protein [Polyangiaceae bacterium]|jgi:5-methyltetrahydropteroyltriglutamate--homocysteine methyltransferase|nr:cobalamin-independent methionine synthase II family protein [Polyangiaceae bacterium]